MTLIQLRALVAIVDAGLNVTLAASRIHATQPGLSKQLRQLEDELGFRLFQRRGRSFERLTPEGRQVVDRARAMLDQADAIRALSRGLKRDNGGRLALAAAATPARYALPAVLAQLRAGLPDVAIQVQPAEREEALARLSRGEADAAVVSTSGITRPTPLAVPCWRWRRVAVVPRGHALARGARPTLAGLAAQPLVGHASALREGASLPRLFAANGLSPRIAGSAHDAASIKAWVRAGLGVGLLSEMALEAGDTDLVVLPLDHLLPPCTTWLSLRTDRALSAPIDALVAALAPQADRVAVRRWLAGDRHADYDGGAVPVWSGGAPIPSTPRPALASVSGFV
ncbi:MAG: LysR substrate-binding domain-containing protein [Pseudomonadota bacterium]|jgi:LysR family cys regulon transcriptional activator